MILDYFDKYVNDLSFASKSIDEKELIKAYGLVLDCCRGCRPILVFGNGGSASVAEHLSTDWTKGIAHDSIDYPHVIPLVSNQSLITAIANDYGYDKIFSKQIEYYRGRRPLCIAISSSGNSANIVNGLEAARIWSLESIALIGFDGGAVVRDGLSDTILHVKSYNYGLVEDAHSVIMHSIAQHIRLQMSSSPEAVKL
jgi:phosphoheptose isomerase